MIPKISILLIAIIGAFVNGFVGFFVWGICAYIAIIAFGWLYHLISGGLIPRKIKNETATDFICQFPELVKKAYPGNSPDESKQNTVKLLELMMKASADVTTNINEAKSQEYFPKVALMVADEQPTEDIKELARKLVCFLNTHRLWWGTD